MLERAHCHGIHRVHRDVAQLLHIPLQNGGCTTGGMAVRKEHAGMPPTQLGCKLLPATSTLTEFDRLRSPGAPHAHGPHSLEDSDDEERPQAHTKSAPTAASGAGGRKRPAFLSGATHTQHTAGAKATPARDWGPHR